MAETLYAAITASGTVERVIVADPNAADLQAVLTAVTPTGGNAIDVTAVSPQPGAGWAYTAAEPASGATPATLAIWTPPTPPAATAAQTATTQIQALAETLPATVTQATADAATLAGLTAGQPLTAEQVAAIGRHANGWVQLLDALGALATATGIVK